MDNRYGYVLKRKEEKTESVRYHRSDLEQMTIFQLKEICRREKIIQGVVNSMDKEELIRTIVRYRGADEHFLIRTVNPEGWEALERVMNRSTLRERKDIRPECSSVITVYEGKAVSFYDGITLSYDRRLEGTNAVVVSGEGTVCGIFNLVAKGKEKKVLYLTKSGALPCKEDGIKNYSLYCMDKRNSEILYDIYSRNYDYVPEHLEVYRIPLLDFVVREPVVLSMPIAVDFGTANTAVGVWLDDLYFEKAGLRDGEKGLRKNTANYTCFYDSASDWEESVLLPGVVGVLSAETGNTEFVFGYEAIRMTNASYIDEGFSIFHDIKRWAADYEKQEEICDRQGRRSFVSRKEILKAYFKYILEETGNRFKCEVRSLHLSCPVKQKERFFRLFEEILPEYVLERGLDEGTAVLYGTVSDMMRTGRLADGQEYRALLMDCGGGTTDLCSGSFRVWDRQTAYQVEIDIAYENGNTEFGGNNLTYRVMQFLKVVIADRLTGGRRETVKEVMAAFQTDICRYVDEYGKGSLYEKLEKYYGKAESILPTRFKEYEQNSREDYFRVKNNFYLLFQTAEQVKKEMFGGYGTLRIVLSSEHLSFDIDEDGTTVWIPVDKWKLSVRSDGELGGVKAFPDISISIYDIERLLTGDIYVIVKRFMEDMYQNGRLEEYSLIKMTGQSCKMELFRNALKEFVPGRTIQFRRKREEAEEEPEMKLACVDGALQYLKDRKYGFADITINMEEPALPYQITAYTHNGEEVILINGMERGQGYGMISRNTEDLMLKLYLKDLEGWELFSYTCCTVLSDFREVRYEDIAALYKNIRQADTDNIGEKEVRFFLWENPMEWTFQVVPVYRMEKRLFMGKKEEFSFEHEGWMENLFDGTR